MVGASNRRAGVATVGAAASEDLALLTRALDGDAISMRALLDRILPVVQARVGAALLRRRAQVRGRSLRQESEDIVQDVCAALFEREGHVLRGWSPERGLSLKSFVGLVAERELGMMLRSRRRNPFSEHPTELDVLEQHQSHSETHAFGGRAASALGADLEARDLLRAVLDQLRERLSGTGYFVFELLFVEDCATDQAAELTGLSRDALYAWRTRIMRQAREIYDEVSEPSADLSARGKRP